MRIREIASSAEYRMEKKFQNLPMSQILVFQIEKKIRNFFNFSI